MLRLHTHTPQCTKLGLGVNVWCIVPTWIESDQSGCYAHQLVAVSTQHEEGIQKPHPKQTVHLDHAKLQKHSHRKVIGNCKYEKMVQTF